MSAENPLLLLLEDSLLNGARLERMILTSLPDCRLIWARDIEEARLRTFSLPVDLFLVDVELPDGNGLDFLCEMATVQPEARGIVLTAASVPKYRERSAALGAIRFLEKPVNLNQLQELIRAALSGGAQGASAAFRATLNNLSPIDILQLKCLTGSSSAIEVRSGAKLGRIHIVNGQVAHAEAGPLSGVQAFNQIVRWRGGKIQEHPVQLDVQRTISSDWQQLLMSAAQEMDEQGGGE